MSDDGGLDASHAGMSDKIYKGGEPNKIAQLGDCPILEIPSFENISDVAKKLLGENGKAIYESWPTYWNAVFLNTVAAAASSEGGVDFSHAKFEGFYTSDKVGPNTSNEVLPYGIIVSGAKGNTEGRHAEYGSVELDTHNGITHIDVDLFNVYDHPLAHNREKNFNDNNHRPTHPGDVAKQLARRKISSGVSCK